jgi:hypothetical protein
MRRRQVARSIAQCCRFHAVADFDVAQMHNLSRPAVGIHRIAEAIAADTGVRMTNLRRLARRTNENMRVQMLRAPIFALLRRRSGTDQAAIADFPPPPITPCGPGITVTGGGVAMHDGWMKFAPLRESRTCSQYLSSIAMPMEMPPRNSSFGRPRRRNAVSHIPHGR